jgi:hypothetical protein
MEVPAEIWWECIPCGDDGVISGWEGTYLDLRSAGNEDGAPTTSVLVTGDVASAFRELRLLDADCERVVFRAERHPAGVVLSGSDDTFDELVGFLAFEANHETDRRRQKRLDQAFDVLMVALEGKEL